MDLLSDAEQSPNSECTKERSVLLTAFAFLGWHRYIEKVRVCREAAEPSTVGSSALARNDRSFVAHPVLIPPSIIIFRCGIIISMMSVRC